MNVAMNDLEYGIERDNRIVQLIENGGAFTRKQLQDIFVPGKKSGQRIMQHRLQILTRTGRIKRYQRNQYEPCIYYTYKPRQLDHTLLINDVYVALTTQKPNWYTVDFKWSYRILEGKVIADAMATIYRLPDRQGKLVVFIEVERSPSRRFDKPEKYESVFKETWYQEEWATLQDDKAIFPRILIMSEEEVSIKSNLKFIVATRKQVTTDIYHLLKG